MTTPTNDVRRESVRIAGLFANGRTPTEGELADAKRRLAYAKVDREIRRCATDPAPDAVDLGHLVGSLLMWGGSPDDAATRLKRVVNAAVYVTAYHLTDDDRAELTQIVAGDGTP